MSDRSKMEISRLEKFIDYELRCAKRYRRFVSLIVIHTDLNKYMFNPQKKLQSQIIRECDEIFHSDEKTYILLSETDSLGAQHVFGRIKKNWPDIEPNDFSIVTYPDDGITVRQLFQKANLNTDTYSEE